MAWDELVDEIIEYYSVREDDFKDDIEALDDATGYLDDSRCYDMYELDDYCSGLSATEILNRIDMTRFSIDDYYFIPLLAGWESCDEVDYSEFLDDEFVETLYESWEQHPNWYNLTRFVNDLFVKYKDSEE